MTNSLYSENIEKAIKKHIEKTELSNELLSKLGISYDKNGFIYTEYSSGNIRKIVK